MNNATKIQFLARHVVTTRPGRLSISTGQVIEFDWENNAAYNITAPNQRPLFETVPVSVTVSRPHPHFLNRLFSAWTTVSPDGSVWVFNHPVTEYVWIGMAHPQLHNALVQYTLGFDAGRSTYVGLNVTITAQSLPAPQPQPQLGANVQALINRCKEQLAMKRLSRLLQDLAQTFSPQAVQK